MPPSDLPRMPERAREVLRYFLRNPQAADSLEGVARWRLVDEAIYRSVDEINQALGWLVDEGLLLRESVTGLGPIFRLNVEREPDARHLVTKVSSRH